jgi:hypothetical protein
MANRALTDRKEMIAEWKAFRLKNGLPFDAAFVPKSFADPKELEIGYWDNESAAEEEAKSPRKAPQPLIRKTARTGAQTFVTRADLNKCRDGDLKLIGRFIAQQLAPLARRITELETLALKEGGVWTPTGTYKEGEVVTHDGALWVCKKLPHGAKPGPSAAWRLLFKTRPRKETK